MSIQKVIELLESFDLIKYQYTGSREAMTVLQRADDAVQSALAELHALKPATDEEMRAIMDKVIVGSSFAEASFRAAERRVFGEEK